MSCSFDAAYAGRISTRGLGDVLGMVADCDVITRNLTG